MTCLISSSQYGRAKRAARSGLEAPVAFHCVVEREPRLPFVDTEPDATLLEQAGGELVVADEVDTVDQFGRVTFEERSEHLRECADVVANSTRPVPARAI